MIYDSSIFRAYDIRGTYPNQMNEHVAYAAGQAFVQIMGAKKVVVGRDVRPSGPELVAAMIRGITDAGADAVDVGVISTDMLYYASAKLECDGGMSITASHNPAGWSGIKFIAKGARPITQEGELGEIYEFIKSGQKLSQFEKGTTSNHELLPEFLEYLKGMLPHDLPQLTAVINPNFGPLGKIVDGTLSALPIKVVKLNWEEDGTFPKGTPDPLLPSNRKELVEMITKEGADFGAAFDADGDRAFVYDEKGRFFHGYFLNALLIKHFLEEEPAGNIIAERRLVWAVRDAVEAGGGKLTYSRTGHGYFKAAMREHEAIFGGEMSGHYYFREFFGCDSGILTLLTFLKIAAPHLAKGGKISELLDAYLDRYFIHPQEMNFIAERAGEILDQAKIRFADATLVEGDGVAFEFPTWYCTLRMSSNEPILRINVEAKSADELEQRRQELLSFVEEYGATLRDDNH